jgi:hypothetical protein
VDVADLEEPFVIEFAAGDGVVAFIEGGRDEKRLYLDIRDGFGKPRKSKGKGTRLAFRLPKEATA